jgi:hypothetical protein
MPDAMEGIVRPFQSEDFFTRGKIPVPSVNKEADPVVTSWGAKASLPSPESDLVGVNLDKQERYFERSRKTEKIRIENPNDPSQYVVVERPKEMKLDHQMPDNSKKDKDRAKEETLKTPTGGGGPPSKETASDNSAYYTDLAKEAADPNNTAYSDADPKPIINLDATMIFKPQPAGA